MKKLKATGNKIHVLRRVSVGTLSLSAFLLTAGIIMLKIFTGIGMTTGLALFSNALIGIGCLVGVVGIGTLTSYVVEKIKVMHYKKVSMKNLQKIAESDKQMDPSLTEKQKTKIVQKYANANIKLAKIIGCPFVGRFLHLSGLSADKQNEEFNISENLHIEKGLTTTTKASEKIDRIIGKYSRKKTLYATEPKTVHIWTKTYTNFKKGVAVPDRRIEINSLSDSTVEKFKTLTDEMSPATGLGGCVQVVFGTGKEKQTYIRVADTRYLDKAVELLIEDVKTACKENPAYRQQLFPFTVVKSVYDKNAKYTNETVYDEAGAFKSYDTFAAKYNSDETTK